MYFIIAIWPLRLTFLNSFIPGQLIPIFFVGLLSLLTIKKTYKKSKNIDLQIVFFLMIFILLNASIQGLFNPYLIEYRITSLVASLIPIVIFFIFINIDINEDFFRVMSRYLFIGSLFYVAFYLDSFLSGRLTSEPHQAAMGQRDSIYLNFALLIAVFRNYHSDHFSFKILGFLSAISVLLILFYSQTRGGYVLLLANLLALSFVYKKYFLSILLPFFVFLTFVYVFYFSQVGNVYELISANDQRQFNNVNTNLFVIMGNQIQYSIASFNTLVDSFLAFFSEDYSLEGSVRIRFLIWDKILEEVLKSPVSMIFGSGEIGVHSLNETFLVKDDTERYFPVIWTLNNAESQFFDTFFRRGFVGIIFLFTLVFRFIYIANYLRKYDQKNKDIALVFFIWLIGLTFLIIFLPVMRDRILVMFFFINYAVLSSRLYKIQSKAI
jgi:hypothetical protein